MIIKTNKAELISLALANSNMILTNALTMPDSYIEKTYGSEMEMLNVADAYINLAIKINDRVTDLGEDAHVKFKHYTEQENRCMENKGFKPNAVKKLLMDKNISYREFADAIGCTEVAINKYLSGERIPKGPYIVNMANYLDCDISEIYE